MNDPLPSAVVVRSVTFDVEGTVIEYCIPANDARQNGLLIHHSLYVPDSPDYDDGVANILDAATALVHDVLEDMPHLEPLRPDEPQADEAVVDDDDEEEDDDDPAGDGSVDGDKDGVGEGQGAGGR